MTPLAWLALFVSQTAPAVDLPHPFPADYIHYSAGGLMSRPSDVFVDLSTGQALVATADRDGLPLVHRPMQMSPAKVALFRREAAAMIAHGGRSTACRRRLRSGLIEVPLMDARASLSVGLAKREAVTPVRLDCWSHAAKTLAAHVYRYVDRERTEP